MRCGDLISKRDGVLCLKWGCMRCLCLVSSWVSIKMLYAHFWCAFQNSSVEKKKKIKEILKYQENGAWGKRNVAVMIKGKCKTRAIETNTSEEKPDDFSVSTTFTLRCAAERQMIWQRRLVKTSHTWLCTGPRNRTMFNSLEEVPQCFLGLSEVNQWCTVSPHEDVCFLQCWN